MVSCYWVQPAQLHPWFKPDSLKRKSPSMLLRSESPSPVDEDDPDWDSRVKRQRRTTLTLEHERPKKRKLPSCPQSPTEEDGDVTDARSIATKRQRCMVLEHGFERLSLTPPSYPATQEATMPVPPTVSAPPEFAFSSSFPQWVDVPPVFQQISSPTNLDLPTAIATTAAPVLPAASAGFAGGADLIFEDVKMCSSSWYEPEKDRIVITDLDASSDDEQEDGDGVDDAPKLPRAVLRALLRGGPDPAGCGDVPRMLLAGLPPSPVAPSSSSFLPPLPLELASFFPVPGSSDEAMDIEQ